MARSIRLPVLASVLGLFLRGPLPGEERKEAPAGTPPAAAPADLNLKLDPGAVYEYEFKSEKSVSRREGEPRVEGVRATIRVEVLPGNQVRFRITDWSAAAAGTGPEAAKEAEAARAKDQATEPPPLTVEVDAVGELRPVGPRERPSDDIMVRIHEVYQAFDVLLWNPKHTGNAEEPLPPPPGKLRAGATTTSAAGHGMRYRGASGEGKDLASFVLWHRLIVRTGERETDRVLDVGNAAYRLRDGFLSSLSVEHVSPDPRLKDAAEAEKVRRQSVEKGSLRLLKATAPGK